MPVTAARTDGWTDKDRGGSSESGSGMEKEEGWETLFFLSLTDPHRVSGTFVTAELKDHHPTLPANQDISEVHPCFKPKDGFFG